VLVRPPLLTAREELLAAAHAALTGALDAAGGSGTLALAAIKRAWDLFRLHEPKMLEKRLHGLLEAKKLTGVALVSLELGRSEQAAAGFITARRLIGRALPRVEH